MTDPGYYDQSIPPALLAGGARPASQQRTASRPASDQQPSPLLVRAGEPGQYVPAVKPTARPRNVTELNTAGVTADPDSPWTAGQYVTVGTSGKRAHWNGEEWRGGESPGFPATVAQAEPEAAVPMTAVDEPATARHAAPEAPLPPAPYTATQFPGDEKPGDLTR